MKSPAILLLAVSSIITSSVSASTPPVVSRLTCEAYVPRGASNDRPYGNLNFSSDGVDSWGWPGLPMITKGDYDSSFTFFARSCNSTSLGLHPTAQETGCDANGDCTYTYTDYIQILNPVTGHCMGWDYYNKTSPVIFDACDHEPFYPYQLFRVTSRSDQDPGDATMSLVTTGNWSFVVTETGHVKIEQDAGSWRFVTPTYLATTST